MGYSGILTSDMFGLRTTLDNPTELLLRERRSLTEKEALTAKEKQRLIGLDARIEKLGFTTAHWDGDYKEYLQERRLIENDLFKSEEVTPDVQSRRKKAAAKIIKRILSKNSGMA